MKKASIKYGEGRLALVYPIVLGLACLTGVVLMSSMVIWVHLIMLVLLVGVLLLSRLAWHSRATRVVSRILVLLPFLFLLLTLADVIVSLANKMPREYYTQCLSFMCVLGVPTMSWMLPGSADMAAHRGRYDRWIVRLSSLWLTAMVLISAVTPLQEAVAWTWDVAILRYLWAALAVAQCALCLYCCRKLPEDPEKPGKAPALKKRQKAAEGTHS